MDQIEPFLTSVAPIHRFRTISEWSTGRKRVDQILPVGWSPRMAGGLPKSSNVIEAAVLESDALDDFRQLVFSVQSPPGFCRRGDEVEHHELGGHRRQGALRPHRSLTHRGSIGFDVRRWSQCSAGKSKKASKASRSLVRQATAFSYLAPYFSANTSIAASAIARVGAL
jgi:hypothetical protein